MISRALYFYNWLQKFFSLLLELLHFQETHHRFHQYDRLRRFFRKNDNMVGECLNEFVVMAGKDNRFFKILQSIIQT